MYNGMLVYAIHQSIYDPSMPVHGPTAAGQRPLPLSSMALSKHATLLENTIALAPPPSPHVRQASLAAYPCRRKGPTRRVCSTPRLRAAPNVEDTQLQHSHLQYPSRLLPPPAESRPSVARRVHNDSLAMGDPLDDDPVFRAFNDRRLGAESSASAYGSALLLILAGLYATLKALELLGYPVWFWMYMALGAVKGLGSRGSPSAGASATHDDANMQSGILGRTFGLNTSGLLHKGVRGVAGALSKAPSAVPPGLGNWDNSCYQNSVIQGLASLSSLHEHLLKATDEYGSLDAETTNGALYDMVTRLNDPTNRGQNFWVRGKLKSMSTFQQQDAQEYYSKILDALDEEVRQEVKKRKPNDAWAAAAKVAAQSFEEANGQETLGDALQDENKVVGPEAHTSVLSNPLDGLLAQRVGCIKCGYVEGLQLIPFNCVTVSLGQNSTYDIRECLDDYTHLEHIEGVECAKCTLLKNQAALASLADRSTVYAEKLKRVEEALEDDDFDDKTLVKKLNIMKKNWTQSTKSRQAVVARAPKALVLHVNRSIFDEMTGAMYKNSANVSYPRVLDLGNWVLGGDVAGGIWPRDPTKSMLGDAQAEPVTKSPYQYRLRAAVTHYGSHGNGHYVCYRPHATTLASRAETDKEEIDITGEQWWRFSDDSVYAIPEQEAHQGNIFMLFYERIDCASTSLYGKVGNVQYAVGTKGDLSLPPSDIGTTVLSVEDDASKIPSSDDKDLLDDQTTFSAGEDTLLSRGYPMCRSDTVINTSDPVRDLDNTLTRAVTAYPTPPPEFPSAAPCDDTEVSGIGSTDALSIQMTSDQEAEDMSSSTSANQVKPASSLHFMRTAGDSTSKEGGNRTNLPMITAT